LIIGDSTIAEDKFAELAQRAKNSNTKMTIFHTPTENGELENEYLYKSFTEASSGYYVSVANNGVAAFYNTLASYRQSYSAKYRSNNGTSGRHDISFVYQGLNLATQGSNYYTINLLPPQATVIIPSVVERKAIEVVELGFVYDKKEDIGSVQVKFPDEFSRKIDSIVLIINQSGKPELRIPVEITSSSGDTYQFKWNLGDLGDARQSNLSIKAEIVDELYMTTVSPDVPVVILSHIPLLLLTERYYLYVLLGVVVILLAIMFVMWRRMRQLMSGVGQRITNFAQNVRQTLVGGGKSGKPLATLRIVEGPPAMIGQELKVTTEVVKLGRDPQKADMTFYTPDTNSSISGLHARIERVNNAWRIVAVSQRGSETFIDDMSIPFNEPYPLASGQTVRLGYIAQQPVTFVFNALGVAESPVRKTDIGDYRRTDLSDSTVPARLSKPAGQKQAIKPLEQGSDDDIFNEFRDR
jgi:hypothetical protein